MTRDETIEAIAVMQAWVDGKDVEYSIDLGDEWRLFPPGSEPNWKSQRAKFRIKPEPRVIYVNEYGDALSAAHHMSESSARLNATGENDYKVRKFIEVLD